MKKKIDIEELKIIQLDVLSIIDEFCRCNNIKYSLGCGTMLGAIRHKGYIPWDDDIDIYLLRNEYVKLITLFPIEYKGIRLASLSRDKDWDRSYSQAYDTRNVLKEARHEKEKGIAIDIYPIDEVPDNEDDWLKYNRKRRFFQRVYESKIILFSKNRSIFRNVFLLLCKIILLPLSARNIAAFNDKFAQKYNGKGFNRVFECCQGMLQKHPFSKSILETIIDIPFEDRIFMAMKNYHEYLSNAYGDYMKLPPKEKQFSHHIFDAYWK